MNHAKSPPKQRIKNVAKSHNVTEVLLDLEMAIPEYLTDLTDFLTSTYDQCQGAKRGESLLHCHCSFSLLFVGGMDHWIKYINNFLIFGGWNRPDYLISYHSLAYTE